MSLSQSCACVALGRRSICRALTVRSPSSQRNKLKLAAREVASRAASTAGWDSNVDVIYWTRANEGHDAPMLAHPECAARITKSVEALAKAGLDEHGQPGRVMQLPDVERADIDVISRVHAKPYLKAMEDFCDKADRSEVYGSDTYYTFQTWDAVATSAGAACRLVDAVVGPAELQNSRPRPSGFLLSRPPGHHAVSAEAMGFCFVSTAAVAARYAQERHGLGKVMIFDFDAHHGNGTQAIFYDDPTVLYVSHHQQGIFPGTGTLSETGSGDGEGATINVPLTAQAGDACARAVLEEVVWPAALRFQPDILVVSAGYDAHFRDPLAGLSFGTSTFHHLVGECKAMANQLCGGRMVVVLEGGYDLKGLSDSVCDSFNALLGRPSLDTVATASYGDEPISQVAEAIKEARIIHGL